MKKFDLIIIGGGVLGAFHAYHALEKGMTVALFERNNSPQGATVRNFGQVVPSGFNTKWQKLGRRSLEIYKGIQSKLDISARQNGTVYLASNDEEMTLLEELWAINRSNDYPSEMLTARQCLQKYRGLRSDYVQGGLFFPEEITLEPSIAIHRILQYLKESKGLVYFSNSQVDMVQTDAEVCFVRLSNHLEFRSEKVIICSGNEFRTLFPEIFAASDLVAVKIQMLELGIQPTQILPGSILTGSSIRRYEAFSECPSWSVIKSREAAETPERRWGIHILFKQTISGSVIVGDSHEYADAKDADHLGFSLDWEINDYILERAQEVFDLENRQILKAWFGIYSQCKTQDIFLHEIDGRIHICTGIGGKGMTGSAGFAEENLLRIFPY